MLLDCPGEDLVSGSRKSMSENCLSAFTVDPVKRLLPKEFSSSFFKINAQMDINNGMIISKHYKLLSMD